ncbi:MAG TPA: DinB family protein [Candidatus Angelobacter sp.]|nr:DinB family protein [Candidatus Angelobacter sp.]
MSISATFLPEFDQEMANTRKILERVPEDKFGWKPHAKSMELGRLAGHIAQLPEWAVNTMAKTSLDLTPADGSSSFKPFHPTSQKELVEGFDKYVKAGRDAIAAGTDEAYHQVWSLIYKGHTVLSMPRVAVIRTVVMNHIIHHRGQLGVYLRLNDVAVPGMYGPSADDPVNF